MNKSYVVAAALIAWSATVTTTLNAGNVSWGDTQAVITAAVMAVVMVIGVGTLTAVAVLFPWRHRSSFILRLLRRWSMHQHRSSMHRHRWFMLLLG